jgi:transcriptional regulator with XRE-family HTH domain
MIDANMGDMKRFAQKLNAAMSRADVTQQALVRLMGTGRNTVHRWCKGEQVPPVEYMLRLARALDVSLEYLVDDEMDEPPKLLTEDERIILLLAHDMGVDKARRRLSLADEGPPSRSPQSAMPIAVHHNPSDTIMPRERSKR